MGSKRTGPSCRPTSNKFAPFFLAALERPADAWPAYLDEACAGDSGLQEQVRLLLDAHAGGTGMLDHAVRPEVLTLEQPPLEQPGTEIGPYKLLEQIGEGGMGVVYMAEQQEPIRRKVALKIIKLGMDTEQVIARFEAERQALALMDHPNIAKVLDAGRDRERPALLRDGVTSGASRSREYCDQNNLTTNERLELFIDGLPGGPARPSEGDHPPRPQAVQRAGHACTTASRCPRSSTSASPRRPSSG